MSRRPFWLTVLFLAAGLAAARPDAAGIKPTPVTLTKQNATAAELAGAFWEAPAGVAVTAAPGTEKAKAAVAFDGTPFWEALETAADRTKTRLTLHDGGRSVI